MVTAPSGDLYVTGVFRDSIILDPNQPASLLYSKGGWDTFIARYDFQGNLLGSRKIGGVGADLCFDIKIYNQKVYLSGTFQDTVEFNEGGTPSSLGVAIPNVNSGFVVEFDLNLNFQDKVVFGGSAMVNKTLVSISPSGKILISGTFSMSGDFSLDNTNIQLSSNGGVDTYFVLCDSSFSNQSAKSIGGINTDALEDALFLNDSIAILAGIFSNSVDFNPDIGINVGVGNGAPSSFILALNGQGEYLMHNVLSNDSGIVVRSIGVDEASQLYFSGNFNAPTDFNPGTGSNTLVNSGRSGPFLLKLDANLNYRWARTYGSRDLTVNWNMDVEGGKILMSGFYTDTLNAGQSGQDVSLISSGMKDAYVCVYDTSGDFTWAGRMGGLSDDEGWCISGDGSGGFVVGGIYLGPGDFDPGPGTDSLQHSGLADIFISRVGTIPNSILEKSDKFKSGCRLYPNPGTDRFVLISDREIEHGALEVYAADGKLIKRLSGLSGKSFEISGSFLPGLYLVRLSSEKFQETATWLVE